MLDLEGWSNSHSRTFSPNSFQIYKSCNEIGLFLHLCTKKILSKWVNNILDSDHLMLPGTYFQIMTHLRQFLGHKKIKYLDIAVCSKIIQMHPFIYEFLMIFQIMPHLRPFLGRKILNGYCSLPKTEIEMHPSYQNVSFFFFFQIM